MGYEPIRRGARPQRGKEPTRLEAEPVLYGSPLRRLRGTFPWTRVAHRRPLLLVLLVLVPTTVASGFMVNVLPNRGGTWVEVATVAFFASVMSGSATRRSSFALGSVVRIASCVKSELVMLRSIARRWLLVRFSFRSP